jgi:putative PEP-CTERM system TPR-repeat lipoprotein
VGQRRRAGVMAVLVTATMACACSTEGAARRYFDNGARLLAEGRVDDAIIELRNAVGRDERWGDARFKLADAYAASGNPESAFREYIRAADLMPDHTEAQLKAVTYLVAAGQHEDAQARVYRVLAREPGNVEAQVLLGNALAGLRDLDGAVAQINEAIALEPDRSQSYSNLGMLKVALGRLDEARAAFEKAVTTDPNSAGAWLALANFAWAIGDSRRAESSLQRALELDDSNVMTHRALATFYSATGRAAEAEPHLKLVVEQLRTPFAKLELADHYISREQLDEARALLEPLTTDGRVAAIAESRLAGLAYADGDRATAHKRLDEVIRREPNNAMALLLKARWLLSEGRRERALVRATAAVSANPQLVPAHYIRGLAEAASHRSSDAIKSFTEVLRLNPRATVARIQLSRLYLARNAIDSAVLYAEEALANAPESLGARLALVRAWIARDDLNRARAALLTLREQAGQSASVHALEGSWHLIRGDQNAARTAFERALALDAAEFDALSGITTLDVLQGRIAQARERLDTVMKAGVEGPDILVLAAKVAAAGSRLPEAERLLRRVIDLDPFGIEGYELLGRVLSAQQRLDAARREFEAESANRPGDLAPRMMAALIAHAQNEIDVAKARYQEILKRESHSGLAANNLASIYADAGEQLDVAQQLAESAADQFPMHPEVHDTLGWIYYQRHAIGQAIRHFELSVAADPGNPKYHYHLGLAHSKNGETDRARRALQTALKLNPRLTEAQTVLVSLQD